MFGPRQVIARISQDQTISPQITLWNQQGSQVIWGTLMVIPIEESLIYVQPLYLRGAGRAHSGIAPRRRGLPEPDRHGADARRRARAALRRTAATAHGRPSSAVEQLRPRDTRSAAAEAPGAACSIGQLAAEARTHYERAIEAQRAGDWAKYGEEIRLLGETLGENAAAVIAHR